MILASANIGDFRVWLVPLLWGLVIFSLVSGYSIRFGKLGWRIYSRKTDPFYFWLYWSAKLIVVNIITYLLLAP